MSTSTFRTRRPIPLRPDYTGHGASAVARAGAIAIVAHVRDIPQARALEILETRAATTPHDYDQRVSSRPSDVSAI